jgi:hypothetical protein
MTMERGNGEGGEQRLEDLQPGTQVSGRRTVPDLLAEGPQARAGAMTVGILDGALDSLRRAPVAGDLRFDHSLEVVAAYGTALGDTSAGGAIADARELPYSKDAIKHALRVLLRATRDAVARESLRIGYVRLADWQSADDPSHEPIHFGHATTRGNPLALAMQLAASRDPGNRLHAAAKAEREALAGELRRLGL